jgi:neutral ceramidase
MYTISQRLLIAALLLLLSGKSGAELRAGAAKVDITPDVKAWKVPLGGYADRRAAPATEVQDIVYARALLLADGKTKVALVSADLCFLPANIKTEVLKRLATAGTIGIGADNLLLVATHTHSAPDPLAMHTGNSLTQKGWTAFDARLLDFTVGKITEAIVAADKRLVPAKAGSATGRATGFNRNRRGEKTTDDALNVLNVTTADGKPLATLVNFAAHPTLDDRATHLSADWPGVMTAEIERAQGKDAICLFFNGSEGDASPNGAEGTTAKEKIADFGRKLAAKANDLLAKIETRSDTPLAAWTQTVTLPPRKPNALFILAAAEFGATIEQSRKLVTSLMPEKTTLGFVRVGDLLLMGFPCEPTAEIGLAAKEKARKAGFTRPAVVALANDWLAYALTPEQYRAGNYEAGMSFYGDKLGPTLLSNLEIGLQRPSSVKPTRQ